MALMQKRASDHKTEKSDVVFIKCHQMPRTGMITQAGPVVWPVYLVPCLRSFIQILLETGYFLSDFWKYSV